MNQQKIILFLGFFFLVSAIFLAYTEKSQHTLEGQWFMYFSDPKNEALGFSIENHTTSTTFDYNITCNDQVIHKDTINIPQNSNKAIKVTSQCQEKSTIQVSHNNNTQELYKFNNLR
jgi:hypothetical protein